MTKRVEVYRTSADDETKRVTMLFVVAAVRACGRVAEVTTDGRYIVVLAALPLPGKAQSVIARLSK